MKGRSSVALVCSLAIVVWAPPARASSLSAVLEQGRFAPLRLAPLGPALANTVALTYPVASASSSVTYVYNPALDVLERRTGVGGPIIGERAETIGRGVLDIGLSYSYVRLTRINGEDLDHLVNRPVVDGRVISFPVPDGTMLKDGRFTNFLPVRVVADLGIDAHIVTPSLTYGVTPDLDVNIALPVLHTALDVETRSQIPDPRLPSFALPAGSPLAGTDQLAASASAAGVGDLLLRAKYLLLREQPVDVAALLGLSLPTGNRDNFQGTGTTRVQPALVLSRVFGERFEPLLNVGVDINADDVSRSIVRWAVGTTAQLGPLTGTLVFLGRHELSRQSDPIEPPFFFQIERNDQYDAAVGLRWQFADSGILSANALVPLNQQGLRADVIPTIEVEYAFSAPW
jgi:outer membrane putative beta-barrel porin/alpha-amylase